MELEFIARNTELTEQQRTLAQKKFKRLAKYFNAVLEARLTVNQERHRTGLDAFIRGKDFEIQASAETPDWATSLQEVVARLEQQARRSKQRLTSRKRPRSKEGEGTRRPQAAPAESERSGPPRVVESKHMPVVQMSVEEAVLQLESSGEDFILFREASSDQINVLHRRRDRTYVLVTPEY